MKTTASSIHVRTAITFVREHIENDVSNTSLLKTPFVAVPLNSILTDSRRSL